MGLGASMRAQTFRGSFLTFYTHLWVDLAGLIKEEETTLGVFCCSSKSEQP